MTRREVLKAGALAAAASGVPITTMAEANNTAKGAFRQRYAPHFGMFRNSAGDDLVDQISFGADNGFLAWEDNGMMSRSPQDQEKIGAALEKRKMTMGVFVANAEWSNPIYALGDMDARKNLVNQMKVAVECAKRVNAKWCTVVPGPYDLRLAWDYQTANVIDTLKAMAEVAEPAGLTMVLEPLNPYRDHPGMFLSKIPQAYMICKSVQSPSCKILFDMYHQQITEGNIIPNIDRAWDEIAYFQMGDNPGRNEPLTGEINYRGIFGHIHAKGFTGVLGMEHGNSKPGKEGEQKVIDAYRWCDAF